MTNNHPRELAVSLTRVEMVCLIRHMRHRRDALWGDMIALEERIRARHNGGLEGAQRALDAELVIVDGIIRKLWEVSGPRKRK